ncbi:MAG: hypothetical protein WBC91_01740 [Phototrophicaceae bacterium]
MMWLNLLMQMYPREWRARYEDEFRAMLACYEPSLSDWLDMAFTALETRIGYTGRQFMKDLLNRLTGLISLVSAVGLGSVFFITDENMAEFMLVISPILSILLIPAMHRILKVHRPKMSFTIMMIGTGALAIFVTGFLIGRSSEDSVLIGSLGLISLILIGIWLIGINLLAIKADVVPSVLGIIGIVAGISWIIVMSTTMLTAINGFQLSDTGIFSTIYGMSLMGLLSGYFIWAIGTGFYFASGRVSRKLKIG